jgi:hypothetical protein
MNHVSMGLCLTLLLAFALAGCEEGGSHLCDAGETQSCQCADLEGSQVCEDDSSGWGSCDCGGDDDDDATGDDDDATADDDDATGDDDDTTPPYVGPMDIGNAALYGECAITVPANQGPPGEGWFAFSMDLEGWAASCWINFWDDMGDYCEAYDPGTGDPCEFQGYTRPGWDMDNDGFGWDPVYGFWESWSVAFNYIMDLALADANGASLFICENAGNNFTIEFCCTDSAQSDVTACTEYIW